MVRKFRWLKLWSAEGDVAQSAAIADRRGTSRDADVDELADQRPCVAPTCSPSRSRGWCRLGQAWFPLLSTRRVNWPNRASKRCSPCFTEPLARVPEIPRQHARSCLKVASVKELVREWNPALSRRTPRELRSLQLFSMQPRSRAAVAWTRFSWMRAVGFHVGMVDRRWRPVCVKEKKAASSTSSTTRTTQILSSRAEAQLPKDLVEIPLEENVRNTQNVCRMLQPHYRSAVAIRLASGPAGQAVEVRFVYRREQVSQRSWARFSIDYSCVENLLPRDIVVLTPRTIGEDSALVPPWPAARHQRLVTAPIEVKGRAVTLVPTRSSKVWNVRLSSSQNWMRSLAQRGRRPSREALLYVAFSAPRNLLVVLHTLASVRMRFSLLDGRMADQFLETSPCPLLPAVKPCVVRGRRRENPAKAIAKIAVHRPHSLCSRSYRRQTISL